MEGFSEKGVLGIEPESEPEEQSINTLLDLMYSSDPCEPNLILNRLKGIRLWNDKKKLISNTINNCGTKRTKKKKGEKRAMSGWNCYLKKCSTAPNMDFQKCMGDTDRKAKEYIPNKDYYSELAGNGCK